MGQAGACKGPRHPMRSVSPAVAFAAPTALSVIVAIVAMLATPPVVPVAGALFAVFFMTIAHMLVVPAVLNEVDRHATGLVVPAVA